MKKLGNCRLFEGDCLKILPRVPEQYVDLILCDLPYEQTANHWDVCVPLIPLWKQYQRVLKPGGAVLLTAKGQFMIDLILSNRDWYRYELVWDKNKAANFAHCNKRPLISHEYVLVFYDKLPTYNPQMVKGKPYKQNRKEESVNGIAPNMKRGWKTESDGMRYPKSIIRVDGHAQRHVVHPTQKPVALMKWLINTYSNAGDVVLDNCMGSGTTGVACVDTGRKFIGIEQDKKYFDIATSRISKAVQFQSTRLFT